MYRFLRLVLFSLALPCLSPIAGAEETLSAPADPAKGLDFWVGTWDLTWTNGEGETAQGTNTITKILGGKVIEEAFDGGTSMPLVGRSWSVYVPAEKIWKQTWVDNNGSYLDFTGGWSGEEVILSREGLTQGKPSIQRMRFHDIQADSLQWKWEISFDEGKTWRLAWDIHYQRAGTETD